MNIIDATTTFLTGINSAFGVTNLTSILIALIGVFAYRFHVEINRKKYTFASFMRFSNAFNRATYLLKHGQKSSYFIVFIEFPKHFSAMLNFIHTLEGKSKSKFNNEWTKYEQKYKEIKTHGKSVTFDEDDEFPEDFMIAECPEEIDWDKQYKSDLIRLIEDLLEVAKK